MTYPISNSDGILEDTSILDICCESYLKLALSVFVPLNQRLALNLNYDVIGLIWKYVFADSSATLSMFLNVLRVNESVDYKNVVEEWVNDFKKSMVSKFQRQSRGNSNNSSNRNGWDSLDGYSSPMYYLSD